MTKKIIILGRSPFINNIDFKKIDSQEYSVCVINHAHPDCKNFSYLVSADEATRYNKPTEFEWISRYTGWTFKYHQKGKDIILKENEISWRHFSSSIAVSFAILRGFEEIYLAGVDLSGNKKFKHFDGTSTSKVIDEKICNEEKSFIKSICLLHGVKLFTLDPNISWLNFKDIGVIK